MRKNAHAALAQSEDTTEELIGVLTAISVVSRRLARKLALLDKSASAERRKSQDGAASAEVTHADQSRAL
ncbi:hypothetical protein [Candidatus Soleaferrea massiliensis]|uniref:hypothetical protein n=1 Tax=Candidatus Soleaferrea massiliensis TaxID=1470354 RepID=UPI00058EBDE1|nr:hypothetical protein [Candidatus Soleaferrea massiliensis]